MRRLLLLAALAALCAVPLAGASPAGAAVGARSSPPTAEIEGSGSTWAENAINQWIADVQARQNLQVVYDGLGSATGRSQFTFDTTDFAVSDIGYQGVDASTGNNDTNCQKWNPLADCRAFAYLPIVAGGTSFPYQIRVGGKLLTNLRLSGETIAKIFTLQITNWDNPEITKDNNGFPGLAAHHLPDLPIIPIVDSQGSGGSAQFTAYLAALYPALWRQFSGTSVSTEYFPRQGAERAEPGSDGIIDFITSAAGNGSIGYDEYSYPKGETCAGCTQGWPVALLENAAGYFTAPTEYNVAVALTKAQINMDKSSPDYLLQKLGKVYTNPDKRAYAMSSYSYMLIPTSANDPRMGRTAAPKAQTLADFIDWAVCGGQREIGPTGYSPLPINLAQASFEQMYKLHTADPAVQISQLNIAKDCNNPTFWAGHPDGNYLAKVAREPPSCDKAGQGPCGGSSGVGSTGNPGKNGKPPAPTGGSSTPASGSSSSATSTASSASGSASPSPGASSPSVAGAATSTGGDNTGALAGSPVSLAESDGSSIGVVLGVLAGFELLLLLLIPAIIARRRQPRDASQPPRGGAA